MLRLEQEKLAPSPLRMIDMYRPLRDEYAWHVPRFINLAQRCCLQWAALPSHARATAIEIVGPDGHAQSMTFQSLSNLTAKLAHGLDRMGARPGDRIAIVMRERVEALAIMLACWVRQCIAVPMVSSEHGDIMTQRIRQSRCRIVFIDDSESDKTLSALHRCTRVQQIVGLDVRADNTMSWSGLLARQPEQLVVDPTRAQQPALLAWPRRPSPAYPSQTAYLIAHQALIGNLPGFVASNNWFPKQASGMLTTQPLMSESGLFGVILPSLYFGIGVRLQSTLPRNKEALSSGGIKVSHLNTTAGMLCQWLCRNPDTSVYALKGASVFGELLSAYWRESASSRFGVAPNLCTFVDGCGLLWGNSNEMWADPSDRAGRVFPGHQLIAQPVPALSPARHTHQELFVSRTDPAGDPDPAIYTGVWPLKDPADMIEAIDMVSTHPCNMVGQVSDDGSVELAGWSEDVLQIGPRATHPLLLEQAVMSLPEVVMAAAIHPPNRKNADDESEVWLVIELNGSTSLSSVLHSGLSHRILKSIEGLIDPKLLHLGIAHRISVDNQGHPRRDLLRLRHGLSGVQPLAV